MTQGVINGYKDLQRSEVLRLEADRINATAVDLLHASADLPARISQAFSDIEALTQEYGVGDPRVFAKKMEVEGLLARHRSNMAQFAKKGRTADRLIRAATKKQARAKRALDMATARRPAPAATSVHRVCVSRANRGRERQAPKSRVAAGNAAERPRSSDDDPAPLGAPVSRVVIHRALARAAAIVSSLGMVSR